MGDNVSVFPPENRHTSLIEPNLNKCFMNQFNKQRGHYSDFCSNDVRVCPVYKVHV